MFTKNKSILVVVISGLLSISFNTHLFSQPPGKRQRSKRKPAQNIQELARQLQQLIQEKQAKGIDTSKALELDRKSREAIRQGEYCKGRMHENMKDV